MPFRIASIVALLFVVGCAGRGKPGGGSGGDGSAPLDDASAAMTGDLTMQGCASADFTAMQAPAAMLVVLDHSSSMLMNNKFTFASLAIVQAIDLDVFNSMWLGLYAAPSGDVMAPACLGGGGFPVSCLAPPFPQIDLALAGTAKSSDAVGVRSKIKTWLKQNPPNAQALGDASPLYDGLQAALLNLQSWNQKGKRILFVVTDGSIDCAQFSKRAGYADCNGCDHDWEDPTNIIKLLAAANKDPQNPVESFMVGVPGADTTGQDCNAMLDNPPYHMRLALSAMAYAGSPANAPANCTGKTFTKMGGDPAVSCHVDLTQGNFKAQAIADSIGKIRGQVLGCIFDLPTPDMGTVDLNSVNVTVTQGGSTVELKRRKDPMNACSMDGCWDYTNDGKVQLIGKACSDVQNATSANVHIVVGCPTIIG